MRIAYIAPGAAGMICGSCLNDNTLATSLIRQGHEVALTPVYTPLRTESASAAIDRVFYGAVNVYLEQRSALFRHSPRFIHRLLNSKSILGWASKQDRAIDARELGELTLHTLLGAEGHQRTELVELVRWLADEYRPQLVHLSNSMLLGLAPAVKEALGVPVLCSLQGEDIFIDELPEPYRSKVFETIRNHARSTDGFIATGQFYVDHMRQYLGLGDRPVHAVPLGIELDGMEAGGAGGTDDPFVIGYLARICPEKGLHLLLDAFTRLVEAHGRDRFLLRVAGYSGARDREYVEGLRGEIERHCLGDAVEWVGEVNRDGKVAFLRSIDVFSVPTVYREPKGRSILEAAACGVPAVQPDHGVFPEMAEAMGGGVLFPPGDAAALAARLEELSRDRERVGQLGARCREAVVREFSADAMAGRMLGVYEEYVTT